MSDENKKVNNGRPKRKNKGANIPEEGKDKAAAEKAGKRNSEKIQRKAEGEKAGKGNAEEMEKKAEAEETRKEIPEKAEEAIQNEVPKVEEEKTAEAAGEKAKESGPGEKGSGEVSEEAAEKTDRDKEKEAMNLRYMRLMADFQNYRKRVEKEKNDIYTYANEKIVTQLLDVIDNFERALSVGFADEGYVEGIKMIFRQFMDILDKAGLEEIDALGKDFDPNFHNAVMTENNPEYESGKVTLVIQKGYLLNKKVIRPSMVKVNN